MRFTTMGTALGRSSTSTWSLLMACCNRSFTLAERDPREDLDRGPNVGVVRR